MDVTRETSVIGNSRRALSSLRHGSVTITALLVICALSLALRLYGLDWDDGYSWSPHPDERAILMKVGDISPPALGGLGVLLDADESPWNPRWFPYGSLPLYLLKGVQLISSLGPGDGLTDLRLAGRAISALADVATVIMVFVLGSRVYGRRTGIMAALLAALAVIHIQLSHFFAVDTLLALFTVLAVYFMYKVAREGRLSDSLLAGAFVGLGLATKVSLAPLYGALVVAHLMYAFSMGGALSTAESTFSQRWPAALRGLAVAGAASIVVLFVVQPYTFLDWSRFYQDTVEQSEIVRRIRDYPYTRQYVDTASYWYHVRHLATWGLGWPLGVIAWAGLLYVSLRGMPWRHGLVYLAVGWGLPMGILLGSTSFLAILLASGIALVALLVTLPLRSRDTRIDVLLLSWVVPYFLMTGAFQVKFLRYLLPMTPFLLLFGSKMLMAVWDRVNARASWQAARPWLVVGLVLLVGSTGFYAISYMAVYRETHTAVRASEWIIRNVPANSVILKEHWEEGLPNLGGYQFSELPLYEPDGAQKTQMLASELARADYLVLFSNRLYGTIPRLPERYPISTEYYRLLFTGQLGYQLANLQATYPELLGVSFVDDTFSRPDVPEPAALAGFTPSPLALNLGFADESFSVYDHPKVLVFENVERLDADTIRRTIQGAVPLDGSGRKVVGPNPVGLMLSPEDAEAQQRGGTWSEIVRPDSWTSRFPVVAWLVVVEGIALLALPITFIVFRPLPDRGFLFSKALGLLIVGLVVWLLASVRWMAFSQASITVALLLLALISTLIIVRRRRELTAFVKEHWRLLLIGEAVFLVAFFSFLVIRMANPDLWHPFRGGEKPMDLAYLSAVLRSSYMPPYDPWFAGGYINYYYWGQFIVATLIRATGIDPGVAFNLAVPLFFAMVAGGSFALVYNLAEGTRRRPLTPIPATSLSAAAESDDIQLIPNSRVDVTLEDTGLHWSPVMAGIGAALFVTVLGNLDGAIQMGKGIWRALFMSAPFGAFDFWRSSRMMPPDPPGHEITEFPFFTFLFADLHAHMMALPFTLLVLGLALAVVVGARQNAGRSRGWGASELIRLAILGIAVGSLPLLNAWDYPTYLTIAFAAVFVAEVYAHGGLGLLVLFRAGLKSLFVFAVGFLTFLPFHLSYETFFDRWYWPLDTTTNTTVLWQFLAISGLFVFIIASFFIRESRGLPMTTLQALRRMFVWIVEVASAADGDAREEGRPWIGAAWLAALVLGALLIGYLVTVIFAGVMGSTIPFVAILLALVLVAGVKWLFGSRADSPQLTFVALIVGVSLVLVIGLDVFRIEGDIDRMNSIFKFYLQIWVMLGLASAYLLWRLVYGTPNLSRTSRSPGRGGETLPDLSGEGRRGLAGLAWTKKAWLGALALLIASASVYPVLGSQDRLRDRFDTDSTGLTLDGTAYLAGAVYHDREGPIDLAADFEGIRWLRENVRGSPVVLEGVTPTYQWGGRVSIYTGLPSVVGWQWHQEQQRWNYRGAVATRIADVKRIYGTGNASEALSLMSKYGVEYVYVGQLERLYYPDEGLRKFDGALSGDLEKVFETDQVAIYRLK